MKTTQPQKTVLVVDDSRTIRSMLCALIKRDGRLRVVGEARDAFEARQKIRELDPDLLTLDVEMPRMDGLEFLSHLMRLRPMPVVMVSSRTAQNSGPAIRALARGAVDCVDLARVVNSPEGAQDLSEILLMAAEARVLTRYEKRANRKERAADTPAFDWNGRYVLVGSSTGGVDALERVLKKFPPDCPPVLISQHMPPAFVGSLVERFSHLISPQVEILQSTLIPEQGHVYFSPGGRLHGCVTGRARARFTLRQDDGTPEYSPSVDWLFSGAVNTARNCVAVLLTGMGRDGARAMRDLRDAGAHTIAQSGSSCVVDGMPRAARELKAVKEVIDLDGMGDAILKATGQFREAA